MPHPPTKNTPPSPSKHRADNSFKKPHLSTLKPSRNGTDEGILQQAFAIKTGEENDMCSALDELVSRVNELEARVQRLRVEMGRCGVRLGRIQRFEERRVREGCGGLERLGG